MRSSTIPRKLFSETQLPARENDFIHGNVSPRGAYVSWHWNDSLARSLEHSFSPFKERNDEVLMENEPAINSIHLNFCFSVVFSSLRSLAFHSHKYWQEEFIHLFSVASSSQWSFLMRKNSFLCGRLVWFYVVSDVFEQLRKIHVPSIKSRAVLIETDSRLARSAS